MSATIRSLSSPAAALSVLALFLGLSAATGVAPAQEGVLGWGYQPFDSRWNEQSFAEISAGELHTVARRGDGSVVAWGDNSHGQCNVPALPPGLTYVEVAASGNHTV